jgi:hypothetical protein
MDSAWSELEVWDTMWPVPFLGRLLSDSTTEKEPDPPAGRPFEDWWHGLTSQEKRLILRWTDMELYQVAPGQDDPEGRIQLPDGGYFWQLTGRSIAYHAEDGCRTGVRTPAGETPDDVLPCYICGPPMLWDQESDDPVLLVDPDMTVRVETQTHTLRRSATASGIVAIVAGKDLSRPAQQLLEEAKSADPAILAVFARPAPPPRMAS